MDPGCKQYSQLDKDFWPLRNSANHVHRDTVGGNETLLSYIWQRMHPKRRNKEEKKIYRQKKGEIINNLTGEFVFLRPATVKDGRTSFTIQKKLEHFPFTVKRYLSFKHQCTIYWPISLGQKYSMTFSSGLTWPRREMASVAEPLAAADTKRDRFLKQNRHLRQVPAPLQSPRPANVNITFICTFWITSFTFRSGVKLCCGGSNCIKTCKIYTNSCLVPAMIYKDQTWRPLRLWPIVLFKQPDIDHSSERMFELGEKVQTKAVKMDTTWDWMQKAHSDTYPCTARYRRCSWEANRPGCIQPK